MSAAEAIVSFATIATMVAGMVVGYWKLHAHVVSEVAVVKQDLADFHKGCGEYHGEYDNRMDEVKTLITNHLGDQDRHVHKGVDDLRMKHLDNALADLKLEVKNITLISTADIHALEERIVKRIERLEDVVRNQRKV